MSGINFWRGVKAGTKNFFRNGWLSVATISVIVLTLFIINTVLSIGLVTNKTLEEVQEKIDVSVYFKSEADEQDIKSFARDVEKLTGVKEITYVSRDEALQTFKEQHATDEIIIQSLEELGNPLQPSISVKMHNPDQYQQILAEVEASEYKGLISDVDYQAGKKVVIEKLNSIIRTLRKVGIAVVIIFSLIAVLVTFNSVRLTMYTYQNEVEIMKLVGASHWFIRFPFLVEGVLYGFFAAWVTLLLFYPLVYFLDPFVSANLSSISFVGFLNQHSLAIIAFQLGIGMLLGLISSFLAIRRYLKI